MDARDAGVTEVDDAISYRSGRWIRAGVRLESLRNTDVDSLAAELLGIGSASEALRGMVI